MHTVRVRPTPPEHDRRDTAWQRDPIATTFADDGWEVPRLLGELHEAPTSTSTGSAGSG